VIVEEAAEAELREAPGPRAERAAMKSAAP